MHVVLVGLPLACFGRPTYECVQAQDCVVGGVMGVCEPEGVCSYGDDSCASGRRYGPYAGELAEACVPEEPTGTGDPMTSSSSSTSSTSSEASSSNDVSSTSCPGDCPQPGEELWSTLATELGVGRAHGVAVIASGIAIAGEVTIEDRIALVVARFDAEGGFAGSFEWPGGGPDRGLGIAALGENDVVVAGVETTAAGDERALLFRLDDGRTVAWSHPYDTADADTLADVAVAGERIIAAGTSDTHALVIARDLQGDEIYTRVLAPPPETLSASLEAVAVTQGGAAVVGGMLTLSATSSDAWILRLGSDAAIALDLTVPHPTTAQDIVHAVATIADGSSLAGGVLANDAWLARHDAAGGVSFSPSVQSGGSVQAIAIADDGTIIAAGHDDTPGHRDAWLAAFDLEATLIWDDGIQADGDNEALALTLADDIAYVAGYRDDTIWLAAFAL